MRNIICFVLAMVLSAAFGGEGKSYRYPVAGKPSVAARDTVGAMSILAPTSRSYKSGDTFLIQWTNAVNSNIYGRQNIVIVCDLFPHPTDAPDFDSRFPYDGVDGFMPDMPSNDKSKTTSSVVLTDGMIGSLIAQLQTLGAGHTDPDVAANLYAEIRAESVDSDGNPTGAVAFARSPKFSFVLGSTATAPLPTNIVPVMTPQVAVTSGLVSGQDGVVSFTATFTPDIPQTAVTFRLDFGDSTVEGVTTSKIAGVFSGTIDHTYLLGGDYTGHLIATVNGTNLSSPFSVTVTERVFPWQMPENFSKMVMPDGLPSSWKTATVLGSNGSKKFTVTNAMGQKMTMSITIPKPKK